MKKCFMTLEMFNFWENGDEGCCNQLKEEGLTSIVTLSSPGSGRLYPVKGSIIPLLNGECPKIIQRVTKKRGDLFNFITDIISDIMIDRKSSRREAVNVFVRAFS